MTFQRYRKVWLPERAIHNFVQRFLGTVSIVSKLIDIIVSFNKSNLLLRISQYYEAVEYSKQCLSKASRFHRSQSRRWLLCYAFGFLSYFANKFERPQVVNVNFVFICLVVFVVIV